MTSLLVFFVFLFFAVCSRANSADFEQQDDERLSSAELGMMELSKSLQNPGALGDALDSLKNPEVMAEVQALMQDKKFQSEMKALLDSPRYKAAMARAQVNFETLLENPESSAELRSLFSEKKTSEL